MPRWGARWLGWLGLLGALSVVALGCSKRAAPGGSTPRVISLSPNTTETVFAIGGADLLVGRSRYCDFPAAAEQLPVVGGFADPSVEAIIGLRPTLVIGSRSPAGPSLAQALSAHGIPSYFPPTSCVARLERDMARIAEQAAKTDRVRAVLVFDASPIVVAGPGGFPDELLRLAGGDNVIAGGATNLGYPTVNIERLLALDPDVVIDASGIGAGGAPTTEPPPSQLSTRPGWSELRAARQDRIRTLRSSAALRPGPRIAEGLAEIYAALHDHPPKP